MRKVRIITVHFRYYNILCISGHTLDNNHKLEDLNLSGNKITSLRVSEIILDVHVYLVSLVL